MADAPAVIDLSPVVAVLTPLVQAAVAAAVAALVGIAINAFNSLRVGGAQISAQQGALISAAAANEAGKIAAGMVTSEFADAKFTTSSPLVVNAANAILGADSADLKAALQATGATPGLIASLVAGEIGKRQTPKL